MKRVAFLSFDWDFEVMSEYYRGMESVVAETDDVQLVIFNAYGQYANFRPEAGALKFFDLCELDAFDAFILQGNRTWPVNLREPVAARISAAGKPVVSINYDLPGATTVGTDNEATEYDLVHRVLTDHHCTRPAFVNGLASSLEAQARLRGFVAACEDCGVKSHRMYQANWEMASGVATAKEMLAEPDDLPDAIFCCNDELAVAVQETLMAAGVRVPEDVMITGFDNREYSIRAIPRVTTVDRDFYTTGVTAARTIVSLLAGESLPASVASPAQLMLCESSGYANPEARDAVVDSLFSMDRALRHFYAALARFQPAILQAESLSEIMDECERSLAEIGCEDAYLSLSCDYLDRGNDATVTTYGQESLLMAVCGDHAELVADDDHAYARFASTRLWPDVVAMGPGTYMVLPLRQGSTCMGTCVTRGVPEIMRYGFLTFVLTLLTSAIESARQKELLQALSSHLDTLYVHDQLTGLYNRFGLERFGRPVYERLLAEDGSARFVFVDVDSMKLINDRWGHEVGDAALRHTGDIITRVTDGATSFAMRFGGDEFLVISREDLAPAIEKAVRELNASSDIACDLSLSVGSVTVHDDEHRSLHDAIQLADARMYEIKKARKAAARHR